jgi:hypothetical protein
MDKLSRHIYELRLRNRFLELRGKTFQDFFCDIMEKKYKGNFMRCKPWGNRGDQKSDGYLRSKRTHFQVYAPDEMTETEFKRKLKNDFNGAVPHWKEYFDTWIFVHNARDGLGPEHLKAVLNLNGDHPHITVKHWCYEDLRDLFLSLSDEDTISLLGPILFDERKEALIDDRRSKLKSAPSVFVSYSHKDKFLVQKIVNELEEKGAEVLIDETELSVRDSLVYKLTNAINKANFIIAVLSPNSIKSKWVQRELQLAIDREIQEDQPIVLPIVCRGLNNQDIPAYLRDKVYADFRPPQKFDVSIARLLRALEMSPEESENASAKVLKHRMRKKREFARKLPEPKYPGHMPDIIIRDLDRMDNYGDEEYDDKSKGASPWFKVEFKGYYYRGIEVVLNLQYMVQDKKGNWHTVNWDDEVEKHKVIKVGRIPFDLIEEVDWQGDEYYPMPHIYCRYHEGRPYASYAYYLVEVDFLYRIRM